ncbi:MAG TPA: SEC-C metal-binding domain-containing protein, partial [Armatimonadota bacterium]
SEQQHRFGQAKRDTLPQYCRDCEVRFVCNGGCPKDRILRTPSGEAGLNYLCAGFRAFFNHIDPAMKYMANELRAQRPPANIMRHMAQQDAELARLFARAGRNELCPCGSGRKFKHCHGLNK